MTIYAWARRRSLPRLPAPVDRVFEIGADTRVLAHCHWQPEPKAHPTLLALHGLEGSSDAHYMRGIADKAFRRGFNVVRLNQRNCGGTEHLSAGLYHSGLTSDVQAVIDELATADHLRPSSSRAIRSAAISPSAWPGLRRDGAALAPRRLRRVARRSNSARA